MMRAVLIVRPQPGADETAARAQARGLEPVVAPLFTARALPWTPPVPADFDAILFTSANAPRLGGPALAAFRDKPCYAVGEATAMAAAAVGFGHVRTGPSDGAAVVQMMARDGVTRAFHPTAEDVSPLPAIGVSLEQIAVYASVPDERLSDVAVAAIHAGAIVLLHSPRSAEIFGERIGERRAQTRIAAISDAAAAAAGSGWAGVGVALEPRDEALLSAASELADAVAHERQAAVPKADAPQVPRQPRRRPWLQPLLIGGAAFALGILAMVWVLSRWESVGQFLGLAPQPVAEAPAAAPPAQRALLQPGPQPSRTTPELDQRIAALEQRLGELGSDAQSAVGNIDRAEGLLVAFAARRALERGLGLGYLEGLLRQRFGESQPEAVGTIIDFAQQPVTLQQLQVSLTEIGPRLTGAGPTQTFWGAVGTELTNLVVVRRAGTQSTDPRERLARAMTRLEAGQVDQALEEVLRLPGRENGRDWMQAAQRYVAARRALDTVELAAFVATPAVRPAPAPTPEGEPEAGAEAQPKQN